MEAEQKPDTYEEWNEWIKKNYRNPSMWQLVDNWFFPTPRNTSLIQRGQFYHICRESWELDSNTQESFATVKSDKDRCPQCGTEVPDNIKMIAMLLSW